MIMLETVDNGRTHAAEGNGQAIRSIYKHDLFYNRYNVSTENHLQSVSDVSLFAQTMRQALCQGSRTIWLLTLFAQSVIPQAS